MDHDSKMERNAWERLAAEGRVNTLERRASLFMAGPFHPVVAQGISGPDVKSNFVYFDFKEFVKLRMQHGRVFVTQDDLESLPGYFEQSMFCINTIQNGRLQLFT